MYPYLHKYLLLNKHVGVPGIGEFTLKTSAASLEGNILHQPKEHILFEATTALADKNFYAYVAHEMDCTEVDAIKNFHEFTYQLKDSINKAHSIVLPGIGTLTKQPNSALTFEAFILPQEYNATVTYLNLQVPLTQNITVNTTQQINLEENIKKTNLEADNTTEAVKKDYWWIYAAIIALTSFLFIYYKLK